MFTCRPACLPAVLTGLNGEWVRRASCFMIFVSLASFSCSGSGSSFSRNTTRFGPAQETNKFERPLAQLSQPQPDSRRQFFFFFTSSSNRTEIWPTNQPTDRPILSTPLQPSNYYTSIQKVERGHQSWEDSLSEWVSKWENEMKAKLNECTSCPAESSRVGPFIWNVDLNDRCLFDNLHSTPTLPLWLTPSLTLSSEILKFGESHA